MSGCPDNIHVDANDRVTVTTHLQPFAFLAHTADAAKPSLTQVAEIRLNRKSNDAIDMSLHPIFQSEAASGGSIGFHHNGKLLIGTVFEKGILSCEL